MSDPVTAALIMSAATAGATKYGVDAQEKAAKEQQRAIDAQTKALENQPIITTAAETTVSEDPVEIEMGGVDERDKSTKRRRTRVDLMNNDRTIQSTGLMF